MFCYLHKPTWKTKAGNIRSVLKNDTWEIKERQEVLDGLLPDPYDSLDRIKFLHTIYHHLQGIVFILVAEKNGKYDKNISPHTEEFAEKIRGFFEKMPEWHKAPKPDLEAGLHPSWQSGDRPALIKKEMDLLQYEIGVKQGLPGSIISGSLCPKSSGNCWMQEFFPIIQWVMEASMASGHRLLHFFTGMIWKKKSKPGLNYFPSVIWMPTHFLSKSKPLSRHWRK
jgi:hypothetical protein